LSHVAKRPMMFSSPSKKGVTHRLKNYLPKLRVLPCDVFFFDLPGRPGGTTGLFATAKQLTSGMSPGEQFPGLGKNQSEILCRELLQ